MSSWYYYTIKSSLMYYIRTQFFDTANRILHIMLMRAIRFMQIEYFKGGDPE